MKFRYREISLRSAGLAIVAQANAIIDEYREQGYTLTLRQLYYQFVARDIIANKVSEYDKLGDIIAKARYAGLIDWTAIEDRTRNLSRLPFWNSPSDFLTAAAKQYRHDLWENQPAHVEVWVEKEALAGIVAREANPWALGFIACIGYMSATAMWEASQRFVTHFEEGKRNVVLHLGDHDPSGIDMTRDTLDRLAEFCEAHGAPRPSIRRLALNMNQVRAYNPPPNPAKKTDSRCPDYIRNFGEQSWELDALEPRVLEELIDAAIRDEVDSDQWHADQERLKKSRARLEELAATYSESE